MTSETPNLHVLKNLNISKTEKDIEKLKTPLRLVWKCCSDAFQIGSTIFRRRGTLNYNIITTEDKQNKISSSCLIHLNVELLETSLYIR